jgi:hypothetical protein
MHEPAAPTSATSALEHRVLAGSKSTKSVELELEEAEKNMQSLDGIAKFYKLDGLLKGFSKISKHNIIANVVPSHLNPEFLMKLIPMLQGQDLMTDFTTGPGITILKLLSKAYTERRLDLVLLRSLIKDPEKLKLLDKIYVQYEHDGMAAIQTSDLIELVKSIDSTTLKLNTFKIQHLLIEVAKNRTFTMDMLKDALSSVNVRSEENEVDHFSGENLKTSIPTRDSGLQGSDLDADRSSSEDDATLKDVEKDILTGVKTPNMKSSSAALHKSERIDSSLGSTQKKPEVLVSELKSVVTSEKTSYTEIKPRLISNLSPQLSTPLNLSKP